MSAGTTVVLGAGLVVTCCWFAVGFVVIVDVIVVDVVIVISRLILVVPTFAVGLLAVLETVLLLVVRYR